MVQEAQKVAVLFIDIVDSTKIYQEHGNEKAHALISAALNLMKAIVEDNLGRVVKTIGDEIMAVFPQSNQAVQSALLMQTGLTSGSHAHGIPARTLMARAGVHTGEVVEENGDCFGNAVNIAARLASTSKARQILLSGEVVAELNSDIGSGIRFIENTRLKGISDPIDIYDLTIGGSTEGVTVSLGTHNAMEASLSLELDFCGTLLTLDDTRPSILVGRSPGNDIVIPLGTVSRLHARLQKKKEHFILTDLSINGTWVQIDNGDLTHVQRDDFTLTGSGTIFSGMPPEAEAPYVIRFGPKG